MAGDQRGHIGRQGEEIAVSMLRRKRCRILDRNFRTRLGELDIVLMEDNTLVFCEVKARVSGGSRTPDPLEAIRPAKRRQVRQMAAIWLSQQSRSRDRANRRYLEVKEMRFDVIGVLLGPGRSAPKVEHLSDAF